MQDYNKVLDKLGDPKVKDNVDSLLVPMLRYIIISLGESKYGKFVDWNKVSKMLEIYKIKFVDPDKFANNAKKVSDGLNHNEDYQPGGGWMFGVINGRVEGQLSIAKNMDQLVVLHSLTHEFLHYISQNLTPSMSISGKIHANVGMFFTGNPRVGEALNEGITENIAHFIMYDILKRKGAPSQILSFPKDYLYKPFQKAARILEFSMGDKFLYSYFNGTPKDVEQEFDDIGGKHGNWYDFTGSLDKVLYASVSNDKKLNIQNEKIFSFKPLIEYTKKKINRTHMKIISLGQAFRGGKNTEAYGR